MERFHHADGHLLFYQQIQYEEQRQRKRRQNISWLGFPASLKGDMPAYTAPSTVKGFRCVSKCSPDPRQRRRALQRGAEAGLFLVPYEQENKQAKLRGWCAAPGTRCRRGQMGADEFCAHPRGPWCVPPTKAPDLGASGHRRARPHSCLHTGDTARPIHPSQPCLSCKI